MNTTDRYLKAVYFAQTLEEGSASTGTLAELLDVTPASATEMLNKLEADGLVAYEKYNGARLTETGQARATDAVETYCILQRFLHDVLEVDTYQSEAKALESVIDETVADRLDTIIDRPNTCPSCFDPQGDACERLLQRTEAD